MAVNMNAPVLFKKESIIKANWYSRFKQLLIEAGWQSIPVSRPATDYEIFYSPGDGTAEMWVQLREYSAADGATVPLSSTSGRAIGVRLLGGYVPAAAGVAGTLINPDTVWVDPYIFYDNTPITTNLNIYYNINKNRIILFTETPKSTVGGNLATILFLGNSDKAIGETSGTGPLITSTLTYVPQNAPRMLGNPTNGSFTGVNVSLYIDGSSADLASGRNASGTYFMTDIAYGHSTTGIRGYIDGVYLIRGTIPLQSGDTVTDQDGIVYRVIEVNTVGNATNVIPGNFFQAPFMAFREEVI